MKNAIKGMLIVMAVVALPCSASAQQLFDFNGQAVVPAAVGGTLSMYSVMFDPAPQTTPLPLDFDNFQYTLVVSGAILDVIGNPQSYVGGVLTIYEDAGTAADFANTATFTDGTAILVGNFTSLNRIVFLSTGSVQGYLDWVGGAWLNDIAPEDQTGWAFLAGTSSRNPEPGYSEIWDGKVEPPTIIVDDDLSSFGSVKALFK